MNPLMTSALLAATAAVVSADSDPFIKGIKKDVSYDFQVDHALPEMPAMPDLPEFDSSIIVNPMMELKRIASEVALPAAGLFAGAFVLYVALSFAWQLAMMVFNGKLTLFQGFFAGIQAFAQAAQSAVFQKFSRLASLGRGDDALLDDDVSNDIRARRNAGLPSESQLLGLLSGVAEALAKYD